MMSPKLRQLFLKVHNGDKANLPILFILDQHVYCKEMLEHLHRRQITGSKLTEYFTVECGGEPIKLFGKLSLEILKVNKAPKLLKGVNFK